MGIALYACGSHDQSMSICASVRLEQCLSHSMSSSSIKSEFRLRSLLVIPQIFLNTDISETRNYLFCSSLSVQVSKLYSIARTSVWYSSTVVDLLKLFAFHMLWRFRTIPAAKPILQVTFSSHLMSSEMTSPTTLVTNSSHCVNSLSHAGPAWSSCDVSLYQCTALSIFVLLTLRPNLLLVVWTLSTNCYRSLFTVAR